jgi:DNA gyrase subunit B
LATENDLEIYKKKHTKEKFIVNRIKGLGELSPSELYECMIKDDTENIMQLDVQNFTETDNELEKFMGAEVAPRREYYNAHFNDIKIDIE